MPSIDVVVVAYNSRDCLRACVEPFADLPGVAIIVVDNACPERSFEVVADLPGVRVLHSGWNGGFAYGCNLGWRAGTSDYVLLLNPDAVLPPDDLCRLARELEASPSTGVVGPKTLEVDGSIDWTIRRFPSLVSTYAQALFLHRLLPRASWVDEVVRNSACYEERAEVDWLSGSCLLVRRTTLETLDGMDEGFFFYAEDIDLCRRVGRIARQVVVYRPDAICIHFGGRSRPRAQLLPMLAASRLRFARRHRAKVPAFLERLGIGLGEAIRIVVGRGDLSYRRGHVAALVVIIRGDDAYRPG